MTTIRAGLYGLIVADALGVPACNIRPNGVKISLQTV